MTERRAVPCVEDDAAMLDFVRSPAGVLVEPVRMRVPS